MNDIGMEAAPASGATSPPSTPSEQASANRPRRTDSYIKLILAGIIILIVMQSYIILSDQTWTLIPSGTRFTLAPQSSKAVEFSLQRSSVISGTIVATNGFVLYLVNSWQYDNSTSKDNPSYSILRTGPYYFAYTLNWGLPQGAFYIIFTNNSVDDTTITILQSINLSPY